jgi:hypothetical protein
MYTENVRNKAKRYTRKLKKTTRKMGVKEEKI